MILEKICVQKFVGFGSKLLGTKFSLKFLILHDFEKNDQCGGGGGMEWVFNVLCPAVNNFLIKLVINYHLTSNNIPFLNYLDCFRSFTAFREIY